MKPLPRLGRNDLPATLKRIAATACGIPLPMFPSQRRDIQAARGREPIAIRHHGHLGIVRALPPKSSSPRACGGSRLGRDRRPLPPGVPGRVPGHGGMASMQAIDPSPSSVFVVMWQAERKRFPQYLWESVRTLDDRHLPTTCPAIAYKFFATSSVCMQKRPVLYTVPESLVYIIAGH